MAQTVDDEREHKINEALAGYRGGESSIRNLALKYNLPRSTLRDRIKRAKIAKDTVSPQARRAAMLKSRAKVISEKQSKDIKLRERETVIQDALDYYNTEAGDKEGLRSVAARFGIPRSTLRGRILGSISSKHRVQKGQKLSLVEEDEIVSCVIQLCKAGEEVTSSQIRNMANLLQQYRVSAPTTFTEGIYTKGVPKVIDPETGKVNQVCLGWVRGFLGRHPSLIDAKGRILDAEKTKLLTRELFSTWFERFTALTKGVSPDNIYNFDFTSIRVSQLVMDGHRQIVPSNALPHEFVTSPQPEPFGVLECISASGKALAPFLVLRSGSKYFDMDALAHSPETTGWSFAHSDSGEISSDEQLLLNWVRNHFDFMSSEHLQTPSQKRILIGDLPSARTSILFQQACESRNIQFISLPEHTAHELQPLDVGIFTKMKRNFCMKVETFFKTADETSNQKLRDIPASDLIACFCHARTQVVSKANVQKAFKLSGLYPLDMNSVLERIWDPSSMVNVPYDFVIIDTKSTRSASVLSGDGTDTSGEKGEHQLFYQKSSIPPLLNNPVFGVADLVNHDDDVCHNDATLSSSPRFNSTSTLASSTNSSSTETSYHNIAISELIFSSPSTEMDLLSHPMTLPVMKDFQLNPNYESSSRFNACPITMRTASASDRHPLPSLPDALSNTPRANAAMHSLVEIAPLQSHSLLQAQVVPLPSLTSTINGGVHSISQQQPQYLSGLLNNAFYHATTMPEKLPQLGQATKPSSLDFICNKDMGSL